MSANVTVNTKKNQAIAALLTHATITQAADAIDVDARTLHRWLNETEFRMALSSASSLALDAAAAGLVALTQKALLVISTILDDSTAD